jgi:hypothetical protein
MFNRLMQRYEIYLPFAMTPAIFASTICGLDELKKDTIAPVKMLDFLGVVGIGAFVGFTYPISVPLLMIRYTLKKN